MVKSIRAFFLAFTILAFLLFSTVGTTTVYADDGDGTETPETVTTTEEAPPAGEEEQLPAEEETSVGEGEQPVETPVTDVEQPAAGEEPAVEEPAQSILEQVPENTTVTVLNSEGEALPLASQESADAIASDYDPIWCPAGQVPTPGENGCTQSFNSFDELLTFLQTNEGQVAYQQAGTIYIQQGAYQGGESSINFNNYTFNQFNTYDLTLQGGWDTTYDPASGDPTFTSTSFNVPIVIGSSTNPWLGSLTLNNILIDGVAGQAGLTLHTSGVITLDQVEVTNSQAGMDLNAGEEVNLTNVNASNNEQYGARIRGDQIAIDTATFNNNGSASGSDGYGLDVGSLSLVALVSVTADNNQTIGVNIFAGDLVAISQSAFRGNGDTGVKVVTAGVIALNQITADGNYEFGADLQGGRTTVENSSFSNNGSGVETNPTGSGLMIMSTERVTLRNVTANDNQFFGANIQAQGLVDIQGGFFSGHQSVLPPGVDNDFCTAYQVEVADWVDFDFCGFGLKVVTPGDIFLNSVTGNVNNLWGAWLDGDNVSVYNSQFNNNVTESTEFIDDTGMLIFASGLVDIFNTEAKENRLYGARIFAEGPVFITDSIFTGNQGFICLNTWCGEFEREYHGIGLDVTTPDYILVQGTDVSDNNLLGAILNGSQVDVVNSTFNNTVRGDGLVINASNNVALTDVTAVNNAGDGVEVNGVYCEQVVNVTGGTFTDNLLYGITVLNAQLLLDGTQVFGNNGSGDFFNDTSTCVVGMPVTTVATPNTENTPVPAETPSNEETTENNESTPAETPSNEEITENNESAPVLVVDASAVQETTVAPVVKSDRKWSDKKSTRMLGKKFGLDKKARLWDLKLRMMNRTTILLRLSNCQHIAY